MAAATTRPTVQGCLEKLRNPDKDYRYMALSDLEGLLDPESAAAALPGGAAAAAAAAAAAVHAPAPGSQGSQQQPGGNKALDDAAQAALAAAVVERLGDASADVAAQAVKCLRVVIRHLAAPRAGAALAALADLLGGRDEKQREVAALAIQAVAADDRPGPGRAVVDEALVSELLPRMVAIAEKKDPVDSVTAALDAVHEVIARHGHLASAQHASLTACLLDALADPRAGPRRRATAGLAALSASLDDAALGAAVDALLGRVEAALTSAGGAAVHTDVTRGQVSALSALARAAGWRWGGARVGRAVPALLSVLAAPGEDPPDDDRREAALHALEALALRVPAALASPPHAAPVLEAAGAALKHDPNFCDDDEGEDDEGMSGDDGGLDGGGGDDDDGLLDEDEDDAYSIDDADTAWKVRRAGARLLAALAGAAAHEGRLGEAYPAIAPRLVSRFNEREEAVKADVFGAYADVVRLVGAEVAATAAASAAAAAAAGGSQAQAAAATPSTASALASDVPSVARAAARQLKARSPLARQGALGVAASLIPVVPDAVAAVAPGSLLPGMLAALRDGAGGGAAAAAASAGGVQVAAAAALRAALSSPSPAAPDAWRPHAASIAAALAAAAGERYYKLAAEALRAGEALARVLRPDAAVAAVGSGAAPPPGTDAASIAPAARPLLAAAAARLASPDVDAEVREAAIGTAAALLSRAGKDALAPDAPPVLASLVAALGSEATRAPAARALGALARSPAGPPLDPAALAPAAEALTGFLRLESRPLRVAALGALRALAGGHADGAPPALTPAAAAAAAEAAAPLIGGGDLGLAAPALVLASALLALPGAAPAVAAAASPPALALATHPLLQGPALAALRSYLASLLRAKAAGGPELVASLLAAGRSPGVSRAGQAAVAKCVATLCVTGGPGLLDPTVNALLGEAAGRGSGNGGGGAASAGELAGRGPRKAGKASASATAPASATAAAASASPADPASARLALLCIGEVGKAADLSGVPALAPTLMGALGDAAEDVAAAAASALGGAAVRAPSALLPGLLASVRAGAGGARGQYLLLTAVNGAISGLDAAGGGVDGSATADAADPSAARPLPPPLPPALLDDVRALLLSSAETASDGEVRAAAAEGLGHLARLDPASVLPALLSAADAPAPALRAAAVTAARHAVPAAPGHHAVEAALAGGPLVRLLRLAGDPDHTVRQAAVSALAAAAHHRPALVARHLREAGPGGAPSLMDLLLAATTVDPTLIREVDLGPFKHRIDDGLDLRKAAYECLDGLLDRPATRAALDAPAALARLEAGLADHPDVKLPCQLLLVKLAAAAPAATREAVERLLPPLDAAVTARPPPSAVQQEVDRADDLARAALRAVDALGRVPGVAATPAYRSYVAGLAAGPAAAKWAAVREEGRTADLGGAYGGGGAGGGAAGGGGGAEAMDTT